MVVAMVNVGVCKAGNASNASNASNLRVGTAFSARSCGWQRGALGVNTGRRGGVRVEAGLGMVGAVATGLVEAFGHSGLVLVRRDSISPVARLASRTRLLTRRYYALGMKCAGGARGGLVGSGRADWCAGRGARDWSRDRGSHFLRVEG